MFDRFYLDLPVARLTDAEAQEFLTEDEYKPAPPGWVWCKHQTKVKPGKPPLTCLHWADQITLEPFGPPPCSSCDDRGVVMALVPGATGEPVEDVIICPDCDAPAE